MDNFYEILEQCSPKVIQYLDELRTTTSNAGTYETYFNFAPTFETTDSNYRNLIGLRNINYNCASTDEQAENYN